MLDPNEFDDFDTKVQPEELYDDNLTDEDLEPDFDMALEYSDEDYPEHGENDPYDSDLY